MTTILTPQFEPIAFPTAPATAGTPLFDPAIVTQRGVFVAGGPSAISVFQIYRVPRHWYTVKAQVNISGYAVSASSLYIQDGPVLSGWDLTYGGCFGGINLVTKQRWTPPPTADSAPVNLPLSIYEMPPSAAAGSVLFSPPVVRSTQVQGQFAGEIFVLGADGSVYAIDGAIALVGNAKFSPPPLRAELAMAELPQEAGNVLCRLYYITADGGITIVDGTSSPVKVLGKWSAKGTPVAEKVLPLRFQDGLLWGGGILGADFFATVPDPAQPLLITVPGPATGWRNYDISTPEKLVLLTDDSATRLVSYDTTAKQRDRWGLRAAPQKSYSFFWSGTGGDVTPPSPRLTLEIDTASSTSAASFRVLVANTVDSSNPALTSTFPPPPQPLDVGTFGPGPFQTLPKIAWIRCKPVVAQHTMYCVARSTDGTDAVAAFSLSAEVTLVLPAARATIVQLQAMGQPIRLSVSRISQREVYANPQPVVYTTGPDPVGNAKLTVALNPGGDVQATSDGAGILHLDTKFAGGTATLNQRTIAGWAQQVGCSTTSLQLGQVNSITVNTYDSDT